MTGVLDIRTPMAQTEEMYIALKEAGVDTVLVRMNESGMAQVEENQLTGLELMGIYLNGMKILK